MRMSHGGAGGGRDPSRGPHRPAHFLDLVSDTDSDSDSDVVIIGVRNKGRKQRGQYNKRNRCPQAGPKCSACQHPHRKQPCTGPPRVPAGGAHGRQAAAAARSPRPQPLQQRQRQPATPASASRQLVDALAAAAAATAHAAAVARRLMGPDADPVPDPTVGNSGHARTTRNPSQAAWFGQLEQDYGSISSVPFDTVMRLPRGILPPLAHALATACKVYAHAKPSTYTRSSTGLWLSISWL